MFEDLKYQAGGVEFIGKIAKPQGEGPFPAVMVAHDWSGLNDFAIDSAKKVIEEGYIAFAIDLYGGGRSFPTGDEKAAAMGPLKEDRAQLRGRLESAYAALLGYKGVDSKKTAILGFCFGGLAALDLARSGAKISGAISFHGLLDKPEIKQATPQSASVLVLHGHDDPMVKPEAVLSFQKEMTIAKVDWQVHAYGHTVHSFSNPAANDKSFGTVYSERATYRSWQNAFMFLEEVFHD